MSHRALHDRVVVIIGGTTGLGLSAARACTAAGGRVVVCGRNSDSVAASQADLGEHGLALVGDAQDSATAVEAIRLAETKFGRFDALYHVAGGSGRRMGDGPLHEVTDAGIAATLNLNLASLMASNRAAVQAFLRNNTGGVVLNMGSVLGSSPAPQHFATHVYAAAKSADQRVHQKLRRLLRPARYSLQRGRARAGGNAYGPASRGQRRHHAICSP